jgi:hypothetical protein
MSVQEKIDTTNLTQQRNKQLIPLKSLALQWQVFKLKNFLYLDLELLIQRSKHFSMKHVHPS